MHLFELIDMNARKNPDKACVRVDGNSYSFRTVKGLSEKAAGLFQSLGIEKGDKLAIFSLNTLGFVPAFFGALKAGAVVVPINHKLTAREVDYILEHSGSKVLLFDGALAGVIAKLSTKIKSICMDSPAEGYEQFEKLLESAPPFAAVKVSDEDMAEILYTSGTTGYPKGCLHTHRTVMMAGIAMTLAAKFDEEDRILMAMPIWHSSPLNNWLVGITYAGGTMVMIREYHPLHFLQAIQEERCTAFFGAPIAFIMPVQIVPNFHEFDLSSMRVWMYGGGPIPADTVRMLMEKYQSDNFYQCYGMTEAGPTGTVLFPRDQVRKAGSIGRGGLPGCDVKVMKSDIQEAKPGEAGEIWMKADSMMKGYYRDAQATHEVFVDGWYKTGDVARVDEDGYFFIADRIKDMIVTGGENVYSKEVEDAIGAHPAVVEAAVIAIPDPGWGETVSAVIVKAKNTELDGEMLKTFLGDKLAKYKIPRIFKFVDELPHTASGKIMKYKLRTQYAQPPC